MLDNLKVYNVLKNFDTKDLNRLRKFVHSPYFNVNEKITTLFGEMQAIVRNGSGAHLSKEQIWNKVYHGVEYDDKKFRKLCSDLLKLIEKFLAIELLEENPLYQASFLVEAVSARNLEILYNGVMSSARRLSNRQMEKSATFYYHQYQIEKSYYFIAESEIKKSERQNLENITFNLDKFYIAEKLRYYCAALSQKWLSSHEYKLLFIDDILYHIEKGNFTDVPQVQFYYLMYKMYSQPDRVENYFRLKEMALSNIDIFPAIEAREIFLALINFSINELNKGVRKFLTELFDLYNYAKDHEFLYLNGEMTPSTFRNIVVVALRLSEYEWTESFIVNYSDRLNAKYRDNAVKFNLARLYYYKKEYEKVIELLQVIEFEDLTYNIGSKALLMVTYYETDDIEVLYSLMESFRTFLNRKKNTIHPQRRSNYLNLIKFLKRLTRLMPKDKAAIGKLKKEIEQTKNIADRAWLLEKLAELSGDAVSA